DPAYRAEVRSDRAPTALDCSPASSPTCPRSTNWSSIGAGCASRYPVKPLDAFRGSAGGRSGPPSAPTSEVTPGSGTPPTNPRAGESFRRPRALRAEFGRGGLPSKDRCTVADDARIATFFVLQELTHVPDQFRRAVEEGNPRRLAVREHGRQLGRVVIEIAI